MYECESWFIRKAEHQRTDVLEVWCWRGLLKVPWRARRSNQSILKEIKNEYSLNGLLMKLKLKYFSHLKQRANSLKMMLILGKSEGNRRRGLQWMRWLDHITDLLNINLSNLQEREVDREAWCDAVPEVTKSKTQFRDWVTTAITMPEIWSYSCCDHISVSLLVIVFYSLLWRFLIQFSGLLQRNLFHMYLLCSYEEMISGYSYSTLLNISPMCWV